MICNICGNTVPNFVETTDVDGSLTAVCPVCDSRPRQRALVAGFSSLWATADLRILDVLPHSSIVRYFQINTDSRPAFGYLPIAFRPQLSGVLTIDISQPDLVFAPCDMIFSIHSMQEILDENEAMKNIATALKSGGKLIFTVPLKSGNTDRGYAEASDNSNALVLTRKKQDILILKEAVRISQFGNKTFFRKYGEDNILDFINGYGFTSQFTTVDADVNIGLNNDYVLIEATKI